MTEQPEALRLADLLEQDRPAHAHEAAAELRRLHTEGEAWKRWCQEAEERGAALEQAGRQALKALQAYGAHAPNCERLMLLTSLPPQRKPCSCGLVAAITALRERLAQPEQPEQEPVALETVYETIIHWDEGGGKRSRRELARRIVSLYKFPPAQRTWVGLTDEERDEICLGDESIARSIEAKLKEKNNA